jgi:hypothetical protein
MKLPALQLGQGGLVELLIRNGEKIGGAIVGLVVSLLLWKAVSAVRLQSVQRTETPETITQEAQQADANVTRAQDVPADLLPAYIPLAERIDVWRSGKPREIAAGELPLFDRPLFGELSRRDKPTVLAIEDLQVVAGVAVLPEQQVQAPNQRGGADLRQRGADLRQRDDMMLGGDTTRVKVTPYVVVTGLVPVAKQLEEYRRCFAEAQLQDPQRDRPLWSQYKLERAVVGPTGIGRWENVPITGLARPGGPGGDMMLTANDGLPPSFLLEGSAEVTYAGPLPQRLDEPWGAASIHPWFAERLRKALDEGLFDEVPPEEIADATLKDLKATPERFLGKTVMIKGVVLAAKPVRVREAGLLSYTVKDAAGVQVANPKVGTTRDLAITTSEQFGNFLNLGGADAAAVPPRGDAPAAPSRGGPPAAAVPGGVAQGRDCHLVVRLDVIGRTPVARIQEIQFLDLTGEVVETEIEMSTGLLDSFGSGMGGYGMDGMGAGYGMMTSGPGMSYPGDDGMGMPGMPGSVRGGFDYRLFRFVDLTAQPGRSYRYRVTLALRNPNFDIPGQYLVNVDHARGQFLLSEPSEPSPAVTVPETTSLLLGLLGPEEVKRHKVRPGMQEVLVLAPEAVAGRPTLRAVLVEKGGVADVETSLNRPSTVRSRGEDVKTGRVLVDVFGQQSDRTGASARRTQIAEPVEMLFLRPDGRFEVVSAADSERPLARYRTTLEGDVERDPSMPEMEMPPDVPGFPFGPRPGRPSR